MNEIHHSSTARFIWQYSRRSKPTTKQRCKMTMKRLTQNQNEMMCWCMINLKLRKTETIDESSTQHKMLTDTISINRFFYKLQRATHINQQFLFFLILQVGISHRQDHCLSMPPCNARHVPDNSVQPLEQESSRCKILFSIFQLTLLKCFLTVYISTYLNVDTRKVAVS